VDLPSEFSQEKQGLRADQMVQPGLETLVAQDKFKVPLLGEKQVKKPN